MNAKSYGNISTHLKQEASVAFIGVFYAERGPCQMYAEGKRRWRLIKGFKIDQDFIGNIKIDAIEIEPYLLDNLQKNIDENFINGARYRILLKPIAEKFNYITKGAIPFDYNSHLISTKEIIAITKIK